MAFVIGFVGALSSVGIRFRRGSPVEREQTQVVPRSDRVRGRHRDPGLPGSRRHRRDPADARPRRRSPWPSGSRDPSLSPVRDRTGSSAERSPMSSSTVVPVDRVRLGRARPSEPWSADSIGDGSAEVVDLDARWSRPSSEPGPEPHPDRLLDHRVRPPPLRRSSARRSPPSSGHLRERRSTWTIGSTGGLVGRRVPTAAPATSTIWLATRTRPPSDRCAGHSAGPARRQVSKR